MADKPTPTTGAGPGQSREDRLKAALKANMARRKAQARARQAGQGADRAAEAENRPKAGQDKDA